MSSGCRLNALAAVGTAMGAAAASNATEAGVLYLGMATVCQVTNGSQANSQDMNASGLLHVEAGRLRCLLWGAAALSGGHVSGVPVPPVVLRGDLFVLGGCSDVSSRRSAKAAMSIDWPSFGQLALCRLG